MNHHQNGPPGPEIVGANFSISRPTIGLVTNMATNDRMNHLLFTGITEQIQEEDVNLIYLQGSVSHLIFEFQDHLQAILHLLSRRLVSGLIIWGAMLLGSTTMENLRLLFSGLRDFPIINIGLQWEGVPSLIVDDYQGMHEAVLHLLECHRCRRIAFIHGPEKHEEAEFRYRAYADALTTHGLSIDPDLVVPGRFRLEDGKNAVIELFDRRRVRPDAIVASNDWAAIGALHELTTRGIKVPADVKIVGFDDVEDGRFQKAPLTTVRQQFDELGRTAVRQLRALIRGEPVPAVTTISTRFVLRQSCGCANPLLEEAEFGPTHSVAVGEASEASLAASVEEECRRAPDRFSVDRAAVGDIVRRLTKAFLTEINGGEQGFLSALTLASNRVRYEDTLGFFHTFVSALRRVFRRDFPDEPAHTAAAEQLLDRARIIIGEIASRSAYAEKTFQYLREQINFDVNLLLLPTLNLPDFLNLFAQLLPRLGIRSCYLSLFDDPPACRWARLLLAYHYDRPVVLNPAGRRFPTEQLIPDEYLPADRRSVLNLQPLYSREEQLGFFLFEEKSREILVNELLRTQLGMAIRGALLFQEKGRLLASLEQRARELEATTESLARSNTDLEQFAFIASHDLKEPLRKISIFADRLRMDYEKYSPEEGRMFLNRIQRSCSHLKKLIDDLLAFSRLSHGPLVFTRVDTSRLIRKIIADLEPRIEHERADIRLGDLPEFEAEPVLLNQLFQNLLSNALKFHRSDRRPVVTISGRVVVIDGREHTVISVEDNGIGIDARYFERIFVLFQRLHGPKDFMGTGIGLAICKKIIDLHGGTINVESTPGRGSTFIATLPLRHT